MEQGYQYQERGDADTESKGVLIPRARGCQWCKDADTKECYTKGAGMLIPRKRGCQWSKIANTNSEGMLILRAREC
jgi:hypothetical protein